MAQQPYSYPPPVEGQPTPYYPPAQQGYPPAQQGYPPGQGGYVATQPGYPPAAAAPVTAGYPAPGAPQAAPGQMVWMSAPPAPPDCPPGLEYLAQVDQLLIKQQVELLEAFTGFETANKYKVTNSLGQQVYFAAEDTDCCTRQCCGPERPFDMKIMDNMQREVIHLSRPLRCSSCWFPCCLQEVEVQSPPGSVVGYVAQLWSICIPKFAIQNANRETVLQIEGPLCTFSICGDVEFNVLSADGNSQVGKVSKQWSGFVKEAFTDADNFGISFPKDLDVKVKAVILGSAFLIDFMFFEKTQNNNDHHY